MADKRFQPKKKPARSRQHVSLLILLAVLMVGSVLLFWPPNERIHQGLDVQGGLSIVMGADKIDGSAPTIEEMEAARQIIERRVNLLGASEATVQVQGSNQLLVQIPGGIDQTQALSTIGQTGVLEFVNLADVEEQDSVVALLSGQTYSDQEINNMLAFDQITKEQIDVELVNGRVPAGMYSAQYSADETGNIAVVYKIVRLQPGSYTPVFTGADIVTVSVSQANELGTSYEVDLTLNATASQAFGVVTTELAPTHGKVAIVLDGAIQSTPAVSNPITGGNVAITGDYTLKDANSLKTVLQSGSLPVTLNVISSSVVGPILGQEALVSGVLVALIGLALVAVYLIIFYKGIGILTAAAIFVFAILYLGLLAFLSSINQFALSLAGIAGIVLSIGVAADSSILVLERFKEEIRMGRSVRASSITGVKHAIITSIDADLVTLISALSLFFISVGSVKGFGLTLALGVICDIVVMLIFKAPLIRILAPSVMTRHPGFWGIKEDEEFAESTGELARGDEIG